MPHGVCSIPGRWALPPCGWPSTPRPSSGGRARTYALLQLLVVAAFLAWYHGAVDGDRAGSRWLALALLLAALVDQPLILLLLPPLALMALVARGWSWLRQPVVWLQAAVVVVAVAARWLLYQLMVPPGTMTTAAPRAFVDLAQPLAGWQSLATFFTGANRLLPSLLLAAGVVWLIVRARSGLPAWGRAVLSITFLLVFVVLEMLLVVGPTWREPRYLLPLLPLLFLAAEGVAVAALRGLAERVPRLSARWATAALAAVLAALIVLLAYPTARAAASREEWGYDRALALVGQEWQEGDALATIAPAAAFAVLGRADYLAVEEGAQALVVERAGRRVDGWTDLPLLDSSNSLVHALDTEARLWLVVDELRLNRHFGPEFLHLLWARFDLIAYERGTFVFRSRPAEAPPAVEGAPDAGFDGQLRLDAYALSDDRPAPGDVVTVTLSWSAEEVQGAYTAFVHLVDRDGRGIAGHDAPPLGGLVPVERWSRSERSQPFPDRRALVLPADLSPGRYQLEVGLYRPGSLEPVGERLTLDFLRVGTPDDLPAGAASQGPVARFEDGTALYLLDLAGEFKPGGRATLSLAWQAGPGGLDDDYTLFLHLLDGEGQIAQQFDAPPDGGWYPTSYWRPGEVVLDERDLAFSPMLAPGSYRLVAGLYRDDSTRLPLESGADAFELAQIEIGP